MLVRLICGSRRRWIERILGGKNATGDVAFSGAFCPGLEIRRLRKFSVGRCKSLLCLKLFRYSNRSGRAILDFPRIAPLNQTLIRRRDFPVSETGRLLGEAH